MTNNLTPYTPSSTPRPLDRIRPLTNIRAYGEEQFSLKVHLSASKDIKPNAHYFIEDDSKPQQAVNCYDCIRIFECEQRYVNARAAGEGAAGGGEVMEASRYLSLPM